MIAGLMPGTRQDRPWTCSGLTLPSECGPGRSAIAWGMSGITILSCWSLHPERIRLLAPVENPTLDYIPEHWPTFRDQSFLDE